MRIRILSLVIIGILPGCASQPILPRICNSNLILPIEQRALCLANAKYRAEQKKAKPPSGEPASSKDVEAGPRDTEQIP